MKPFRFQSRPLVHSLLASTVLAVASIGFSSAQADSEDAEELRDRARVMFGAVTPSNFEERNDPKAVLGEHLFWDQRLSRDGMTACASCHYQENWGSDLRRLSIDARGNETGRHSQTVFFSMDTKANRWLGDRETGAEQAQGSITGSMGFDEQEDILPLLEEFGYAEKFEEAFPDDDDAVNPENYGLALQAYQATLRNPAPFDDFLDGEDDVLSEIQLRGLRNFMDAGCAGCHGGPLAGGEQFQRFGVVEDYWEHTGTHPDDIDEGLMAATGDESDQYFFRVPILRNIANTGPYFHDGSVETLEDATRIMALIQLGQELSDDEVESMVAFMESLTGDIPVNFRPPEGVPFDLPEGVKDALKEREGSDELAKSD
ncbi:cytochrome-c peroxidase [Thioalkalivibrio sp. ALJ15]|uniref:cytochrome-c peroxidase n=1 Tax=Thioalkalivibrio sp. ALJ15 TaxID=748652 RepID=UPI000371850C|nr:cytochrome c peroxidase [Thioalkalivibrio sp. ALJ15]